ncbi:hypothetical protein P879_07009 [Paragonimus westermani]|uniref:Arf-GAP with SH3 domain, ANK repeat and PH domain-containing protein n=1 Tax=Paragonimus westermani TaxID=34504 RepID=A0A8T0D461_9TREM|nr:hypothetical protein P879_07009 [Paragonimus westermani]
MPEPLTIEEFISDTLQDVRNPLSSTFISKVSSVRSTVHQLDEGIENDKNVLLKTKKLVRAVIASGVGHADSIIAFCDYLEKLGQVALEGDELNGTDIAASLCKFSVVHRDLANMSKHLMQTMNSIVVFPMETFMQGDVKADLKKPFEKALKDYEYKYDKLRKEKVQLMKDTGIFTPEAFTAEMTVDLEKERRKLQLETCEYLIKVNELKAKRSADLLQHLIDFYYAQTHYLRECLGVMDHFGKSMSDLSSRVSLLQNVHDAQKRRLVDTREEVRTLLEKDSSIANRKSRLFGQSSQAGVTYAAQPTQINRAYGTRKNGFLLKRSDGKVKRVWQRRRVRIGDGELWLYHADESKQPVRLTLLTCQVKLPADIASQSQPEGGEIAALSTSTHSTTDLRNHFDLVSNSRTYNFQAEDDHEFEEWISVLNNAMQEEFHRALNVDESANFDGGTSVNRNNSSTDATHDWDATNISSRAKYPFAIFNRTGSAGGGSLGDSLLGSENDLLDSRQVQFDLVSTNSPASRSRGSRISRVGSADALSNDLAVLVSTHGTPSSFLTKTGKALRASIQSSLRWCCPGNDVCADCDRADPEWVSVNLGVLICLECCGAHRELGVHCSRTQSLLMDDLSTNQLLLPRFIGNRLFNEVFESSLVNGIKPKPLDNTTDGSGMFQRRTFVKAKYVDRRYVTSTTSAFDTQTSDASSDKRIRDPLSERFLRRDLLRSIVTNDLLTLIQVYAENFDLMTPFDLNDDDGASLGGVPNMTALHVAVQRAQMCAQKANGDCDSHHTSPLALIEFILQNSPFASIQRANGRGDTALHHAIRCGSVDALKLLIQAGGIPTPMLRSTNKDGLTALQLGEQLLNQSECTTITSGVSKVAYAGCVELLRLAENSMSASTSADQSDSIFSSSDGSEHGLIAKAVLLEAVDQLNSVDWSFQNSRQTGTKQRTSCRRAVSVSHASSALESCASLIWQSNFDGSGVQGGDLLGINRDPRTQGKRQFGFGYEVTAEDVSGTVGKKNAARSLTAFTPSAYGNALATLPRKKGPAPRPPSAGGHMCGPVGFEAHYEVKHHRFVVLRSCTQICRLFCTIY